MGGWRDTFLEAGDFGERIFSSLEGNCCDVLVVLSHLARAKAERSLEVEPSREKLRGLNDLL